MDALRAKSNDLEIQVERLRTDITVAETKESRFERQIDELTDRINIEKKKLADEELDDLQRMINTLKRLVPTTESEIDRHYYYCYGEGAVEVEKTGSVVVYIVKGERVNGYLENRYGLGVPQFRGGDVRLHRVNVFDSKWTNKFGYPFVNTQVSNTELHFNGSFGCLNTENAHRGYATISSIGADYIEAREGNGYKKFKVSACSRIEASGDLPQVGQGFYYEAVPSSADGFNLYSATCI